MAERLFSSRSTAGVFVRMLCFKNSPESSWRSVKWNEQAEGRGIFALHNSAHTLWVDRLRRTGGQGAGNIRALPMVFRDRGWNHQNTRAKGSQAHLVGRRTVRSVTGGGNVVVGEY